MADNDPLDQLRSATAKLKGGAQSGTAVMEPDDEETTSDTSPLGKLRAATASLKSSTAEANHVPGSEKIVPFTAAIPTTTPSEKAAKLGQPPVRLGLPDSGFDTTKIPRNVITNELAIPEQTPEQVRAQNEREDAARDQAQAQARQDAAVTATSGLTPKQLTEHDTEAGKVQDFLMTGSRKLPIPAFTEPGPTNPFPLGVRASNVGELTDLANENLNRPDIPKTRTQAFFTGLTADAVKNLNDMFLSPIGLAASTLGLTEATALARAGKFGGDAAKLAQDYEAMRAAGASGAELAEVEAKMRTTIAAAAKAQRVAIAGRKAGVGAAAGFGVQGATGVASGIEHKSGSEILSGLGQMALGGAAAVGAHAGGGPEGQVKAATAEAPRAATEGANVTAERAAQIGAESAKPPAKPELSKPPEGTIGPKHEPLAPESPATLKAQTDALAKGTNKVVYFPKGTESIPPPPEKAIVTVVPGDQAGAGTWYHTADVKPVLILKKVKDGTFGELLGNHQSKQEALGAKSPAAIVARDNAGNEVKASLVDSSKPEIVAAQAATLQRQFPKAEISVEKPEDVIHERMGTTPKEADKVATVSASQQTPAVERRSSVRNLEGPDFHRTALMNDLRTKATAGDELAKQQLDDLKAHPFEKHEGGDINQMKAASEKTVSREEAEAGVESRKKGRAERFGAPRQVPGTVIPPESSAVSPSPTAVPGERWTGDRGAIPGEAAYFLDGETAEDAKAAITEVEDARHPGRATYEAHLPGGELIGKFGTAKEAARHAEKVVDSSDVHQVVKEIAPEFHDLAEKVKHIDPALSKDLHAVANGEAHTPEHLDAIAERVKDANARAEITKAAKDYRAATALAKLTAATKSVREGRAAKLSKASERGREASASENTAAKAPESAPGSVLAVHGQAETVRAAASQGGRKLGTPDKKIAAPSKFSPEILGQAKHEIRAASELASNFERPGHYFAAVGQTDEHMPSRSTSAAKGIHAGGTWYGVSSSKHIVAEQYPWFSTMKGAGGKLAELAGKEKGAEYERLVNTVAEHIQREKDSAAPVIAEYAPKLKSLSAEIDGNDPELSETLAQLAEGDGRGFKNLRQYIEEKVSDAEQASNFYRLIDDAAAEARQASAEESTGSGNELRAEESSSTAKGTTAHITEEPPANAEFLKAETVKTKAPAEKQNALPGFESAIEEQKTAAERVRGEKLTAETKQPLGNIDNAAGEMERNSPLFRGTGASPQGELLGAEQQPAVGDRIQVNAGALKGKTVEVTKAGASGVYAREADGPIKFVKNGDFEPAPKSEKPPPSPTLFGTTAYSNPIFDPEVWKSVLGYLKPSEAAGQADLRARTGELARKQAVLQEKLKAERNRWRGRSDADMLAFADLVENGEADRKSRGVTLTPKTQALLDTGKKSITTADKNLAVTLRALLDEGRTAVQDLGTGKLQNFIENYFPHIWEEKNKVGAAFGRVLGKRPLEGPKSFLKKREIPTTAEGFDRDLRPVTTNPVDMAVLKMHEMNRYVMAHRLLDDLKAAGSAQFVSFAEKAPDGWKPLDDRVFTVYGNPDIPVKEYYDEAVWDSLHKLAKNLGIDHERKVNVGGTRLGYTQKGTDRVVTRFATPEQVIAHEIGHQMDWKYGLKGKLVKTSPYKEELRKLVDLKWEGKEAADVPQSFRRYIRKGEEKMATMVEALVHAPDKFKKVAPQTWKFLQDFIADKPELEPLLNVKPSMKFGVRTSTVSAGGMVIHGRYYAPEGVAQPINRYVATGLKGIPVYDILRSFGNSLNQVQLGLSGFHLGTTSLNAVISQFAIGVKQAARGQVVKAAKNILTAPAAPIRNLIQGGNIARDYLRPDQAKKYVATAKAIEQAGGRIGMGEEYIDNRIEKMLQSFASKKYFTGILQSIPAAIEAQAIPVLKWTVPKMKLGAFHDLAADILERGQKKGWNQEKIRSEMQKSWDSIDNRFGQVVYDNLNWNKVAKDLAFIGVRSVGWNYGTWRELGGGVRDAAAQVGAAMNGKGFDVTDRMAYSFALPITIAALGALYMYAHTKKWPASAKDYFYPKNGKVEDDGSDARSSLPSYMKDVFAISQHPVDTALHKVNPAIGLIAEMIENKDFYGNEIRNTDDPAIAQLGQALAHVGKSFLPFTLRNAQKRAELGQKGVESQVENFLGVTPAPRAQERTKAENLAHELIQRRAPAGAHTTAEREKQQRIFDLEKQVRDKTLTREALKAKLDKGEITEDEAKTAIKRAVTPGLVRSFKELTIPEALKVWDVASPKERGELKPILETKVQNGFPKMTREDQDKYRPILRRALSGLPTRSSAGIPMTAPGLQHAVTQ